MQLIIMSESLSNRVQSPRHNTWQAGDESKHPFGESTSYVTFDPKEIASSYFLGTSTISMIIVIITIVIKIMVIINRHH